MAKEELYIEAKLDAEQLYEDLQKLKNDIEKKKVDFKVNAKLTKEAQQVTSQVNQITEANKNAAKAAESAAESEQKLNQALQEGSQAFNRLTPEIQKQWEEMNRLQQEYNVLKKAMKDPSATIETQQAFEWVKQSLAEARKEFNRMQAPIKQTSQWLSWLFAWLKWITSSSLRTWILSTFWAFSIAWAIAKTLRWLINTIKESVSTFISFESAFAGVKKTVEATEFEFDSFNRTLKEMTTVIPMAYEDLAKIAELGWQMGVPIENLAKFTETLAAMSVSTNLWLEQAALSLSRIASVMWIDYWDVDRLGSAIVDLWNNFAATESEITTFMEKIAWTANVVWLSAWDVAWISAAITSVWIAAEKWWTAVNKMAIAINDAASKWWEKLKVLAEITWMTQEEFKKLWRTDAWEAFTRVVEWIGNAWQKSIWYIEKLVWTGTRMKEVFLNISSASDKLREAIEMGNEAYLENIALAEEAAKRYGTTESQIQMLNNQITLNKSLLWESLIPLYIKLKSALVEISNALIKVLDWFNQLNEAWQTATLAVAIAGITAAFSALNPIVWVLVWLLSSATLIFSKFYDATRNESAAMKALHADIADANNTLYNTEKAMAQLTTDLEEWKISADEYKKSLKELIKEQRAAKDAQEELSEQLAAADIIDEEIEQYKKELEVRQQAQIDYAEDIKKAQDNIKSLRKQLQNLNDDYDEWTWNLKEHNNEVERLTKRISEEEQSLKDLVEQQREGDEQLWEMAEAYNQVGRALELLSSDTDDYKKLVELLNKTQLDTWQSSEAIEEMKQWLNEVKQEAINARLKIIETQQTYLNWLWRIKWAVVWATWVFWLAFVKMTESLWILTWKKSQEEIRKAKAEIKEIEKITAETFSSWRQKGNDLTTERILWVDVKDKSMDELNQLLNEVNTQQKKYNTTSEKYIALQEKKTQVQDAINKLLKEEEETLSSAWKSEEDLIKIQEKRLELEAKKKVLALKDSLLSEEDYANAVIKINEDLEKAKDDLRKDWYDKEVDAMEKIIEKYKELRKEAEKAFSWLANDVKDVSADISKLLKKIQDLKEDLEDLEKKRVSDLWDRYVQLQKDLEEIDKKIAEATAQTTEWADSWETVYHTWESLQEAIDKATDNAKDYQKEIDKLIEKMKDLESDTSDKLSERYAKVLEEVEKLNKEMEVYTRYDILTDADAKAKATLEEQIAQLLSEKNKIEQNLTDAQLQRAESMVGETETDKILREAAEQKAAYQTEIDDYKNKLEEQKSLLETYRAQESEMVEKYNFLDTKSSEAKYNQLLKQLEDYKDERDAIIKEMDYISQNITEQQLQDAIIRWKKNESELIMENYYTQKQALEDELADYEDQLNKKLELLAKYYWDAALLQQKYWELGVKMSDEDLKKFKEAAENLQWVKWYTTYQPSLQASYKAQEDALESQKAAQKTLENISKNLAKLTDSQLKNMWTEWLRELYTKILQLQLTAAGKQVWTWTITTNSNINQNFNVNNVNDAAVIASAIRRQIKL